MCPYRLQKCKKITIRKCILYDHGKIECVKTYSMYNYGHVKSNLKDHDGQNF